jgi:hypothetical protein
LLEGIVTEIYAAEAKSCSSIFPIPKRNADEVRLITKLQMAMPFLKTSFYQATYLHKIAPLLQKHLWATSLDLKSLLLFK